MCACRGGGLRFSPHGYTPVEQLEQALALTLDTAATLDPG
jgi:hypothetical protein